MDITFVKEYQIERQKRNSIFLRVSERIVQTLLDNAEEMNKIVNDESVGRKLSKGFDR